MTTPIDYAPRMSAGWFRRHRRGVALACLAAALAGVAVYLRGPVGRYLEWQQAWRAVAAMPTSNDEPIEAQLRAIDPSRPASASAARAASVGSQPASRLARADRGLWESNVSFRRMSDRQPRVFHLIRADGVRRIVVVEEPSIPSRPFWDVEAAVLRDPSWFDASFAAARTAQSGAMGMSEWIPANVRHELSVDANDPARLSLAIGYRDGDQPP